MNTVQILCTLRNVKKFLGVFSIRSPTTYHNTTCYNKCYLRPHTEDSSHWLAINFHPISCSGFYFDSHGLRPYIPSIRSLLKRTFPVWNFNAVQLQGLTSNVCGHYYCLFALYLDRGYSPKHLISLFNPRTADIQVPQMFASEFGSVRETRGPSGGGQCCAFYKKR